ncbi:uncharacterized protein LOC111867215 isoform X1 [Cryptotermes secundus]|uniref:uncharacterized protein LOC111867215 isoform X1 n=1 Tax=Cryptotermes secundus TaxID=105785 RepID=UPI000CD7BE4B|nr:uncharacterized protein LOC111867215 isoform X1 [Cryptotermes secundus]
MSTHVPVRQRARRKQDVMTTSVFIVLLLLINQVLIGHAGTDTDESDVDSRTLQKLKKKKLRKLCNLLGMGRTDQDPEVRTLLFLQVQQIQGSPYPVSSDYTSSDALGCHSLLGSGGDGGGLIGSHFGGGGLLGSLLGGGTGGLLGNPQTYPNPDTLADLAVRPERYLRPLYRTLRPLFRFF